jgi:hypothetical protein
MISIKPDNPLPVPGENMPIPHKENAGSARDTPKLQVLVEIWNWPKLYNLIASVESRQL